MKKLGIFFEKVYLNYSSAKKKFVKTKRISKIYSFFKLVPWYLILLVLFPFVFLYGFISFVADIEDEEMRCKNIKSGKRIRN
ncbi:hypothetical protein COY29_03575 [Candidatus Woesebacteria bacterium CG_4_10_14_0_2_um_filter_39_14]|uniref:Uncharacterized protein n=3 Tax=Microgenomates group TaxID=1794810 RepID=A0A2M6YQ46_9BACT|nr:MAG: hypothetical protein COT04_01240 [Candidatus Shapirobacteria bacterium CG07_land_8_20_14_0_80_39_12]PIZ48537.1 MAG: hypothetical protein COY29_03575 [Candidatus Woesebacteria bacterium CG_4_10_14_0_2_um_filter_39_14]PJA49816.1 MAG: hypothetical protein CO169_00865 [Candidatus Shapirobacteria bacterium CG_4_9_14_3_um_filter_39_13]